MTSELDADGFPSVKSIFLHLQEKRPNPTHECDIMGPLQDIETGMGLVTSATCSVCGRPAFNMRDIWS